MSDDCRNMTAEEYLSKLKWYANKMNRCISSKYRREQEYGAYLNRWFSDGECDGTRSFSYRIENRRLPMPENIYLMG